MTPVEVSSQAIATVGLVRKHESSTEPTRFPNVESDHMGREALLDFVRTLLEWERVSDEEASK